MTFDEAGSVLDDKLAMWSLDLEHGELRMNVIGYSKEGRRRHGGNR